MKNTLLILVLIVLVTLSSSAFIVNEREYAVVFQFGAVVSTDYEPGLHFKLPLIQNVRYFDRRILTVDSQPERYLTSENKDVLVDFFVKWKINDVRRFYTATQGDIDVAKNRLTPIVRKELSREISGFKLTEVVSSERSNVMGDLKESSSDASLKDLGIEIIDVRVKRIDFPDELSSKVFDRMRSERHQVADKLRSEGNEIAETIRSDADRQRQVILAEADRDAQLARGEGDAKAAETYNAANKADAEFFGFYRSLEAYRESFKGGNDVLVLDPKSEFFKYFGESAREK